MDIIDIGGELIWFGVVKVFVNNEIQRVVPVIEAIADTVKVPVSIDTYKSSVAEAALSAGASMVNDISGLRFRKIRISVVTDESKLGGGRCHDVEIGSLEMDRRPHTRLVVGVKPAFFRAINIQHADDVVIDDQGHDEF